MVSISVPTDLIGALKIRVHGDFPSFALSREELGNPHHHGGRSQLDRTTRKGMVPVWDRQPKLRGAVRKTTGKVAFLENEKQTLPKPCWRARRRGRQWVGW